MKKMVLIWACSMIAACVPQDCATETALLKQENQFLKRDNEEKAARIRELEARLFDKQAQDDGFLSGVKKWIEQ